MTAYLKQTWADDPAGGTPIDASHLSHMEDGIYNAQSAADAAQSTANSASSAATAAQSTANAARRAPVTTTVAYASTITPNVGTTDVLVIGTLTGNLTLANPTGSASYNEQPLTIDIVIDGTGGRTITFGSAYVFGTDITTALIPTAANSKFELLFTWHAADSLWRAKSIVRGF